VRIAELLRAEGARVIATDPYHDTPDVAQALSEADVVVLATNHAVYRDSSLLDLLHHKQPRPILVDCWGSWDAAKLRAAGFDLLVFGSGEPA